MAQGYICISQAESTEGHQGWLKGKSHEYLELPLRLSIPSLSVFNTHTCYAYEPLSTGRYLGMLPTAFILYTDTHPTYIFPFFYFLIFGKHPCLCYQGVSSLTLITIRAFGKCGFPSAAK